VNVPSWGATATMAETAIHLDTCFLIRALVPGTDADHRLREWLSNGHRLCMDSIAWTEFLCGPLEPSERTLAEKIVTERIDYSEQDARRAAEFFNATGRRRGTLADCMIAASAKERGATLATLNSQDFHCFEDFGLRLA
jgi:predicted nucleic acid-binding protein